MNATNTKSLRSLARKLGIANVKSYDDEQLRNLVDSHAAEATALPATVTAEEVTVAVETVIAPTVLEVATKYATRALSHPSVKDKSPLAIASRVAHFLNRDGFKPESGEPFFNNKRVFALFGVVTPAAVKGDSPIVIEEETVIEAQAV